MHREKWETSEDGLSCRPVVTLGGAREWPIKFPYEKAVDTAWTVYLATHRDVDVADGRRCLLERHLQRSLEASQSETEELTCSGLAYLDRVPKDEW